MRKYLLILALFLFGQLSVYSQDVVDSLQTEKFKKKLISLHDTARINCLLDIAAEYSNWGKDDSTEVYVAAANKESVETGYKYGIAYSLLFSAAKEIFVKKDLAAAEKFIKQALTLGQQINNPKILGKVYLTWSEIFIRKKDPELLNVFKKALHYFQLAGDEEGEADASNWICGECLERGLYEESFDYCEKSLKLSRKDRAHTISWGYFLVQYSSSNMSELYKAAGDYEMAMTYLKEMDKFGKEHKGAEWDMTALIADLFCKMGKYDSAQVYMDNWIKSGAGKSGTSAGHQAWAWGIQAQIYLNTNQHDKAIEIFRRSIDTLKKYHPWGIYAATSFLISIGQAYEGKKDYSSALQYARKGFSLAQEKNNRPEMMRGYQILSSVYHHLGKSDKAYEYLLKYNAIKDSIQNKQFLLRLYNYKSGAETAKKENQISLLNKDNKLKQQKLRQQAVVRNGLVGGLILLFLLALLVFRNLSLKRKKERAELQRKATELESQALRAQMNPHFIFNCLSSINKFILKNETDAASDYLTRFSRLIRFVLANSQLSLIPLSDEIEMLKLYLDMERLRFSESFDYNIIYANTIEPETIYLPPMLLQPFCENAIWHGMLNKEVQGKLEVMMSIRDHQLECIITDNGIGRKKAAELAIKSGAKQKSFGLKITTERLALFNNEKSLHDFYRTEDVLDGEGTVAGTKVILTIKFKNALQQFIKETV